mmetsp:Transcript_42398/g.70280  ORF Transcript_42398/g.70280 Transcript_42398/m.70280 type:complete len:376 (+) Transcript_42398:70-1197(+)
MALQLQKCRKGFVVGIVVHEFKRLGEGAYDAFNALCSVRCLKHEFRTKIKDNVTAEGRFEQGFECQEESLCSQELEQCFIRFELQGALVFARNEVIGSAALPLSTVWHSTGHAYVRKRLQLLSKECATAELVITAVCYGADDTPPTEEDMERPELTLRISGLAGPLCELAAKRSWTLKKLKKRMENETGIPAREQQLLFGIEALTEAEPFYNLPQNDVLELMLLRESEEAAAERERLQWEQEALADDLNFQHLSQKHYEKRSAGASSSYMASNLSSMVSSLKRETITAVDDILEGTAWLMGARDIVNNSSESEDESSASSTTTEAEGQCVDGEVQVNPEAQTTSPAAVEATQVPCHTSAVETDEMKRISNYRDFF